MALFVVFFVCVGVNVNTLGLVFLGFRKIYIWLYTVSFIMQSAHLSLSLCFAFFFCVCRAVIFLFLQLVQFVIKQWDRLWTYRFCVCVCVYYRNCLYMCILCVIKTETGFVLLLGFAMKSVFWLWIFDGCPIVFLCNVFCSKYSQFTRGT